jgi:hypothetical protein
VLGVSYLAHRDGCSSAPEQPKGWLSPATRLYWSAFQRSFVKKLPQSPPRSAYDLLASEMNPYPSMFAPPEAGD